MVPRFALLVWLNTIYTRQDWANTLLDFQEVRRIILGQGRRTMSEMITRTFIGLLHGAEMVGMK